jgi:hypothetical protein
LKVGNQILSYLASSKRGHHHPHFASLPASVVSPNWHCKKGATEQEMI